MIRLLEIVKGQLEKTEKIQTIICGIVFGFWFAKAIELSLALPILRIFPMRLKKLKSAMGWEKISSTMGI